MGLDVYVGPVSRYAKGDWLTIIQQAGAADGMQVEIHRATPEPEDAIKDPAEILQAVEQWRDHLAHAVGATMRWAEHLEGPYWTDKPGWEGYGGLVLLAAYDERPELRAKRGFLGLGKRDSINSFTDAAAYRAAFARPVRYPSLLTAVEWWLPVNTPVGVFEAPTIGGDVVMMSSVDQLVTELELLANRIGCEDAQLAESLKFGPPQSEFAIDDAGVFGLAVFLHLARQARENRQPLILDY